MKKATKVTKDKLIKYEWKTKEPLYIKKDDKRYKDYVAQLKEHGYSDTETWGLDSVIAEFILPRLKRFKFVKNGYPMGGTEEKWDAILDKMIFAFEWTLVADEMTEEYQKMSDEEKTEAWKKYKEGMKLFGEWFRDLWW
jgi:hypothetical protein